MFAPIRLRQFSFLSIAFLICLLLGVACKKESDTIKAPETGTVTDIQGNVYKTIKIGPQWWMAENLNVTKYNDGSPVISGTNISDLQWDTTKQGYYCMYKETEKNTGKLYNWHVVNDPRKLAPKGWHVPSDAEWKVLEQSLGMTAPDAEKVNWRGSHVGEKLKIQGSINWHDYENVWATNESGFSAQAGGCRMFYGALSDPTGITFTGFWWSSSPHEPGNAWYRYLDYKSTMVFRYHGPQNYGFSVRCVKD
jgi:uncharacterized protein (TIGR02145 family)